MRQREAVAEARARADEQREDEGPALQDWWRKDGEPRQAWRRPVQLEHEKHGGSKDDRAVQAETERVFKRVQAVAQARLFSACLHVGSETTLIAMTTVNLSAHESLTSASVSRERARANAAARFILRDCACRL